MVLVFLAAAGLGLVVSLLTPVRAKASGEQ
jgi:hypothetical protein